MLMWFINKPNIEVQVLLHSSETVILGLVLPGTCMSSRRAPCASLNLRVSTQVPGSGWAWNYHSSTFIAHREIQILQFWVFDMDSGFKLYRKIKLKVLGMCA